MTVVQASQEDIRVAYKRLALVQLHLFVQAELGPLHLCQIKLVPCLQVWHPDRNPHCDRRVAQDKFQAIQQAYSGMCLCSIQSGVCSMILRASMCVLFCCILAVLHFWFCIAVLSRPERRQAYHLECLDCWDMKVLWLHTDVMTMHGILLTPTFSQYYPAVRNLHSLLVSVGNGLQYIVAL